MFKPTARLDLLDAESWYEKQVHGLGAEFVRAVDATVAALTRFPEGFPKVYGGIRKAVLRRFPYSLLYTVDDEQIVVHLLPTIGAIRERGQLVRETGSCRLTSGCNCGNTAWISRPPAARATISPG